MKIAIKCLECRCSHLMLRSMTWKSHIVDKFMAHCSRSEGQRGGRDVAQGFC